MRFTKSVIWNTFCTCEMPGTTLQDRTSVLWWKLPLFALRWGTVANTAAKAGAVGSVCSSTASRA